MRKYWWTVWIKVAVVALLLFLGYQYASNKIEDMVSPYLLEQTEEVAAEETEESGNFVMNILAKIEEKFEVKIDFENLIFDYANEYAQNMKEQSQEERNPISEPLS